MSVCACIGGPNCCRNKGEYQSTSPALWRDVSLPKFNDYKLQQALKEPPLTACNCIGPQNGQPLCPCQMRGVQIKDGRYVRVQDLGPAP